jgi:hypothetical protein
MLHKRRATWAIHANVQHLNNNLMLLVGVKAGRAKLEQEVEYDCNSTDG